MCRFVGYLGTREIVLDELLEKPENSLIKQSHKAREGIHGINADGFGVAWYNFSIDNTPGVFKSTQPAWNDNNLTHISEKIKSSCFLAHIRASTVGDVSQNNCHPFSFEEYSFVHNGTIRNFDAYKRKLINAIDDNLFLSIKGNTDSEHFFFLIMQYIKQNNSLVDAVKKAITWVEDIQEDKIGFSRINIAITNGREIMATRFVSKDEKPLSLRYFIEKAEDGTAPSLTLSSEALDDEEQWSEVPENSYIYFNKQDMRLIIESL